MSRKMRKRYSTFQRIGLLICLSPIWVPLIYGFWFSIENSEIGYMSVRYEQRIITTDLQWIRIQEIESFQVVCQTAQTQGDCWSNYCCVTSWEPDGDVSTSGDPQDVRRWPDLGFVPDKPDKAEVSGTRRTGDRHELLVVHFKSPDGTTFDYHAPDETT